MNILHIYKDYPPILGGIENHLKVLAEGQAARGGSGDHSGGETAEAEGEQGAGDHALELQGQLRPLAGRDNPLPQGAVGAMTVSPNHVLYFSLQDRIYFATDSP